MIEPLSGLPEGVIGFQAVGKIEASDYTDVFVPAVEGAAAAGGVRLVFVFDEFDGMSGGAMWQDMKLGLEHLKAWKRTALVTDIDWMAHALSMFSWLTPGEVKSFPLADRDAAIAWAASTD